MDTNIIAAPAAAALGWCNARSRLLLDLDAQLEKAGTDAERAGLLACRKLTARNDSASAAARVFSLLDR